MSTLHEQLEAAHRAAKAGHEQLTAAYSCAVESGNEFAVIYLLNLVGESAQHVAKLRAALLAANAMAQGGKL